MLERWLHSPRIRGPTKGQIYLLQATFYIPAQEAPQPVRQAPPRTPFALSGLPAAGFLLRTGPGAVAGTRSGGGTRRFYFAGGQTWGKRSQASSESHIRVADWVSSRPSMKVAALGSIFSRTISSQPRRPASNLRGRGNQILTAAESCTSRCLCFPVAAAQ
jgi:hypothetical protein